MVAGGRNDFGEILDSCEVNISGQNGWKILKNSQGFQVKLPRPMEGIRGVNIYPSFYITGNNNI